jgi:hypothetical protein
MRTFLCVSAATALLFVTDVGAQSIPSIEQAQRGVDEVMLARTKDPKRGLKVLEVLGCLPSMKNPKTVWVCPIKIDAPSGNILKFTFQKSPDGWRALIEDAKAACAPLAEAERAFKQMRPGGKFKVKGEVDDGEGLFTTDRGTLRDKRGPYRLMCRYEVETASNPDALFITYVWHDGNSYVIDTDVERW